MCVKGTCCSKCVELKTIILRSNTFNQNNGSFIPFNNPLNNTAIQQNLFYASSQNMTQ